MEYAAKYARLWVGRNTNGIAYVLNGIVERKKVDDLVSSIQGSRLIFDITHFLACLGTENKNSDFKIARSLKSTI